MTLICQCRLLLSDRMQLSIKQLQVSFTICSLLLFVIAFINILVKKKMHVYGPLKQIMEVQVISSCCLFEVRMILLIICSASASIVY